MSITCTCYDIINEKGFEIISIDKSISAITKLCNINNEITNNILYRISKIKDGQAELCIDVGDLQDVNIKKVDFSKQRNIVCDELKKRDFTKHDPNFLVK